MLIFVSFLFLLFLLLLSSFPFYRSSSSFIIFYLYFISSSSASSTSSFLLCFLLHLHFLPPPLPSPPPLPPSSSSLSPLLLPQIPTGYVPGTSIVPIAVKYMLDFLDDMAKSAHITDTDIVHSWKNNALALRFWVNMIKNPEFTFDINKSHTVDACLSVIAQVGLVGCYSVCMCVCAYMKCMHVCMHLCVSLYVRM